MLEQKNKPVQRLVLSAGGDVTFYREIFQIARDVFSGEFV